MTVSKSKPTKRRRVTALAVLLLLLIYVAAALLMPLKPLTALEPSSTLNITTTPSNLPFPSYGEAAVGLVNGDIISSHGDQTPLPTASIAKLITALAILKKYPLSLGQNGPTLTLDATDYSFYVNYVNEQGSVVPVTAGEKLSELAMLQAMLVPSGNNIADSLARWAYGSLPAYTSFATGFVKQLGLNNTHIGSDASGYQPSTTSTADDLIKLGSLVMANPVLASIVSQRTINIPGIGLAHNFNYILGTDGIIGIKTGNNNQIGGNFLGAATSTENGHNVTFLSVILGANSLNQALANTVPLVVSLRNDFSQTALVNKGEVLGQFEQPWGGTVQVVAKSSLLVYLLQGQTAKANLVINKLKIPTNANTPIGTITSQPLSYASSKSIQLVTAVNTSRPTWYWRLIHPTYIF